jgi:HlyD family secretion protein
VVAAANPQLLLDPGMTANVKIVTQERRNVLRAPLQAVQFDSVGASQSSDSSAPNESRAVLWILDGKRRKRLPVVTGIRDTRYVEIISDRINSGAVVLVEPTTSAETNSFSQLPPPPGMP